MNYMETDIKKYIRTVEDFPKPGIMFRDITTLLKDPEGLSAAFHALLKFTEGLKIDKVLGIESRGFMLAAMIAERIGAGFVPIRKPGKLPAETVREEYSLEYGKDAVEVHKDAIKPGELILLHDDLLATGGTARAAINLAEKLGGNVVQVSFIIELSFLKGREKLKGYDVRSLVTYDSE